MSIALTTGKYHGKIASVEQKKIYDTRGVRQLAGLHPCLLQKGV